MGFRIFSTVTIPGARGSSPEGLDLGLQTEDTQRRLLEVVIQSLDLAIHAHLDLKKQTKLYESLV